MQQLHIFPNPFNISSDIEIPNPTCENLIINCYDLFGKAWKINYFISNTNEGKDIKIFKGDLSKGMYVIRITYENNINNIKIIIN